MLKPKQPRQLIACGNDQLQSISSFVCHCAHFTFHRKLMQFVVLSFFSVLVQKIEKYTIQL